MNGQNELQRDLLTPLWKGALAGAVATVPMTAAMLLMHRSLPFWQRRTLPPRKVAMGVAQRLGLKQHMSGSQKEGMVWFSHFGYGAAAGAVYGPIGRKVPLPAPITGIAFGGLIWALSYLGWLPVMQLPGNAADQPAQQNAVMIASHVVWGGATGLVSKLLKS